MDSNHRHKSCLEVSGICNAVRMNNITQFVVFVNTILVIFLEIGFLILYNIPVSGKGTVNA